MSEPTPTRGDASSAWERELLERFAFAALQEQRRARRWSVFFKLATLGYLLLLLVVLSPAFMSDTSLAGTDFTALVDVQGAIMADTDASADVVVSGLRAAFQHDGTAGVIIRINSPGGSPVQAGYINDEIYRLREAHPDIPVYAVIQDTCASGGYYVASAAEEIYADKASLVGSIGVLMDGFGFVEAMDKLGIERRLLAAGEHKGFLDPYSPMREADVTHVRTLLDQIHQQFVNTVLKGRRDRLKEDPALFSGLVWTGEQSLELGLVDGLGSASYVARELIGAERIVNFTPQRGLFDRLAARVGAGMAAALFSQWQARLR